MGNIRSGPLPSRNWKWPNISTTVGILTPNYIYSCFLMSWRIKWYICHELRGCSCPPPPRNCKWPNIFKMIEITTLNHLCSCSLCQGHQMVCWSWALGWSWPPRTSCSQIFWKLSSPYNHYSCFLCQRVSTYM